MYGPVLSSVIDSANAAKLKLVASNTSIPAVDREHHCRKIAESYPPVNYFKSAQWSADGTCVITNSADNCIRTFVIPPELLEDRAEPLQLEPYTSIIRHEPTDAVTLYPGFDLQDVSRTLILSAVNEHPVQLNNAFTTQVVASYPVINPTTEAYVKPYCLAFANNGSQFLAGSKNLISMFDLSRSGQEPVSSWATGSRRQKGTWENPGTSMRGIVSALHIDNQSNILAAGTLTRQIGLYDTGGFGECIGVFSIRDTKADEHIGGQGVTQVYWSPCGRYLYIAERKSMGILMYDIRKTGQLLGWLEGRRADTNQRLYIDISYSRDQEQHSLWGGGTDGYMRMWDNPYNTEGPVSPSVAYPVQNDSVSSSTIHPGGTVLATASGQRHFGRDNQTGCESVKQFRDDSLKLWNLENDTHITDAADG